MAIESDTTPKMGNDFGYMYSRQAVHEAQQARKKAELAHGMHLSSINEQPDSVIISHGTVNNCAVIGFLYSMSRGVPEYWPLHLGANLIGRGSDCDVQLNEMSVSKEHACINVKQMKSTGHLIASIRDIGSQTGLYLNDEELDYDGHSCKNLDIIQVGNSYKFLLMLVDSIEHGLVKSNSFVPDVSAERQENDVPAPKTAHKMSPQNQYQLGSNVNLDRGPFNESADTEIMS